MTTITELRAEVQRRFALLDAPAWPNPHDAREATEEEYSRVTEPQRYGIVPSRARVWREVLADAGASVTAVAVAPQEVPTVLGPVCPDRVLRVDPPAAADGALPVYFLEGDATPETEYVAAFLALSVGAPECPMLRQPDCGCDACDSGSTDQLETVDDGVARAIGPTVMLHGTTPRGILRAENEWTVFWAAEPMMASATGALPFEDYSEVCARIARGEDVALPAGTQAQIGRAWFPTTS